MKLVRYFHNLFLLIFFGKTFPRYFSDLKINKVGVTGGPLSYLRPYSSVSGGKGEGPGAMQQYLSGAPPPQLCSSWE